MILDENKSIRLSMLILAGNFFSKNCSEHYLKPRKAAKKNSGLTNLSLTIQASWPKKMRILVLKLTLNFR